MDTHRATADHWERIAVNPDRESELREAVTYSLIGRKIEELLYACDLEKDRLGGYARRGKATPADRSVMRLIETVENALGVADDPWCFADAIKGEVE